MFCAADRVAELEELNECLRVKYKDITVDNGKSISYLGMTIESDDQNHVIMLSQRGCVDSMMDKFRIVGSAKTPSQADLFERG